MTNAPRTARTDGAALRGTAMWLAITLVVIIGLALAVRHGGRVTALLGGAS